MARKYTLMVMLTAALAALPLLIDDDNMVNLLLLTYIIAGLAASWNILGGYAGQINLGHAAFFGIGSIVTRQMWLAGFPFALSLISGALAAALAAAIVGFPAFRFRGIYFAIGTLATAEALRITIGNLFPQISTLPTEVIRSYSLMPRYYLALGVLILIVVITWYLGWSRFGLSMMAVREDEDAARAIGVDTLQVKRIAFSLSAFLAGLVGGTFAFYFVSYYPSFAFGPQFTFDALIVTFVGGIGTIAGPLLGSVFFVLIRDVLAKNLEGFHLFIFGLLFIVVVLSLPGGLIEVRDKIRYRFNRPR